MKPLYKYILLLLFLSILLTGTGYLLASVANIILNYSDITILSLLFSLIAFITLVIFLRGQTKGPESQTLYSLVAVNLKFLLELVIALIWFIVAKKTSLASVLIFFVLYLTFTLFLIWIILKTLKNKSL